MLTNLTDLVTSLTTQQAMILRQTQPVCAAILPPAPLPPIAADPIPLPPIAAPSIQSSGSSRPPGHPIPPQEVPQNPFPPCLLPQPTFFPPSFPPFLTGRNPLFAGAQALLYKPDPFFSSLDSNASFFDAIRQAPVPEDFRPPRLEAYRGVTDLRENIQGFEAAIRYRQLDEATKCHLLASTLKGAAFSWFVKLPRVTSVPTST
ncbi:hypothetical protein AXF42_Ash012326 [Apostasia shenzhenica]|uniref:Retrotransposon gag domain-containing protein n=1 Tax=Apostasia shenzhenica TaxID=1088818 RepID=A0A2I0ACW0_9ASPA|nr:hypothetical protein AXF42_Ash012326 [Apostasia shenzhenica]